MLIEMKVANKQVIVVGGGEVGERKVQALLREGAKVTVASKDFTDYLSNLGKSNKINLKKIEKEPLSQIVGTLTDFDIIIAATDDEEMNIALSKQARSSKIPICVVDHPDICDFYFPATTDFGNLKIAVSTGGKSPAMASVLRKRLEKYVTKEDVLQVELQDYARKILRLKIKSSSQRKKILYEIMEDNQVSTFIKEDKLEEAKKIAEEIINKH
ncbi:bifunctional precorrin-2 dehydrogenase/sirohydrochlorin ferrochelatase [Candidatus Bathyarchaeota archaeon]|jgi:precorrin-2 dehydrogenase/sirohydrochlorin ferrochelatase|nr:bifunctional precorrin-2 dehydrogenase/sirohydrochlorin ferrochelatase [Candidatus Bathyarchaeota archaeon]